MNSFIEKATLPAILGKAEVIGENDNHTYEKTPEQKALEAREQEIKSLNEQLAQSDEAAIAAFEAQAATDEAIIALYEKIGG